MTGNRSGVKREMADVIVCGAGAPGLTLALLLARLGLAVTIIDRIPLPTGKAGSGSRTSALMQGTINILKATGVWTDVVHHGEELRTLRIIDDSMAKNTSVDFKAEEIGLDAFGVNMPNGVLTAALAALASKADNITVIAPATLNGAASDAFGVTVALDDERILRARLFVGADGRQSVVRGFSGISAKSHEYHQSAITCLISHTRPHDHVSTEFHRPSGPFTLVPLPGNRSSVVWVDHTGPAETFMAMSRQAFAQALQDRTKGILGEVTLDSTPSCFPLSSLTASSLTAPRTVLIAEAAHVLHPLGAQGLNLSLRDAAILAETIADAVRLGQDPGQKSVLRIYERKRRHDLMSRVVGTDSLNRLVSNDLSLLKSLRHAGLRILGDTPPLKRLAMRQGLAPALDDSRLARGEQI